MKKVMLFIMTVLILSACCECNEIPPLEIGSLENTNSNPLITFNLNSLV